MSILAAAAGHAGPNRDGWVVIALLAVLGTAFAGVMWLVSRWNRRKP